MLTLPRVLLKSKENNNRLFFLQGQFLYFHSIVAVRNCKLLTGTNMSRQGLNIVLVKKRRK